MRQLGIQNSRLQSIHAAVDPFHDVIAFAAVPSEGCHPVGELIVVGHNASGIPVGAKVLAGIKGEGRNVAKGSDELSLVPAPDVPVRNLLSPTDYAFVRPP